MLITAEVKMNATHNQATEKQIGLQMLDSNVNRGGASITQQESHSGTTGHANGQRTGAATDELLTRVGSGTKKVTQNAKGRHVFVPHAVEQTQLPVWLGCIGNQPRNACCQPASLQPASPSL